MGRSPRMTRAHAALLLGVEENASVDDIQRAWRVWVRLAHPDTGGDREHFDELMRARRCLMASSHVWPVDRRERPEHPEHPDAPARASLRSVIRPPTASATGLLVALVVAAVIIAVATVDFPAWMSAAAMGLGATAVAVAANRVLVGRRGDVGHRIAMLVAAWSPVALCQVAISLALGSTVIVALPVLVLPLVSAVALVNPGAGLWRPVRFPAP